MINANPNLNNEMNQSPQKRVAALTLGCKLNYSESAAILDKLTQLGWQISTVDDGAELIIVHTCAVTKKAEQKCRQKLRTLIRNNPESRFAAIGCYAQLQPEILTSISGIDAILGTEEKFNPEWYEAIWQQQPAQPIVRVSPAAALTTIHPGYSLPAHAPGERTRAFLKIQDGCNYGCTYCTIPLIRGTSRSLPVEAVIERACQLAVSGYREIVLTGVNTGDYHWHGTRLHDILKKLESLRQCRIRISSIEPDLVDDELIEIIAASPNIVPHLHIPLQHGSDTILKAMGRRYTTANYRKKVEQIVSMIPGCATGADVMIGFPGEREQEFMEMYRFLQELPLAFMHIFTFSPRPGTPLARTKRALDQTPVPSAECTRRFALLDALKKTKEHRFKETAIGSIMPVLFETAPIRRHGCYECSGYTPNYMRVTVTGHDPGELATLKGTEHQTRMVSLDDDLNLLGSIVS